MYLALTSIVSASMVSALTAIGSGGTVYFGFIYVPEEAAYIAIVPYSFIFLSVFALYNTILRNKPKTLILCTFAYLLGFYFSLISTIILMENNTLDNYLSFAISFLVSLSGCLAAIYKYRFFKDLVRYFTNRDVVDKFIVSIAFLLLALPRISIKEIYLPIPLTFLLISWAVMFIVLKGSPIVKYCLTMKSEIFIVSSTFLALTNLAYLVLLRALL